LESSLGYQPGFDLLRASDRLRYRKMFRGRFVVFLGKNQRFYANFASFLRDTNSGIKKIQEKRKICFR
jgi:hypothetical protein